MPVCNLCGKHSNFNIVVIGSSPQKYIMEIFIGLILLLIGGDTLVRGAMVVARKIGISELMIGLTLVGFGTSTPELVTSINAALSDSPGIAVGNVIGSNIANILLILGVTALIYPIACPSSTVKWNGIALLLSACCCVAAALYGELSLIAGILFITFILSYVRLTYMRERWSHQPSVELKRSDTALVQRITSNIWFGLLMTIVGISLTIVGAKILVDGAIGLARSYGISETTIGLTIVAVGTSLPELVTSIMAALRKNASIALGNVIGSNIYNVWFILGITAVIHPVAVPQSIMVSDIWVMLTSSLLLMGMLWKWQQISRSAGFIFILLYACYIVTLV